MRWPKYLAPIVVIVAGCGPGKDIHSLSGPMSYRKGFDLSFLRGRDQQGWTKTSRAPQLQSEPTLRGYRGYVTVRIDIPDEFAARAVEAGSLAFFSGFVADVSRFYFNGVEFGRLGEVEPYVSGSYRSIIADIPATTLRPSQNQLAIVLYTPGDRPLYLDDPGIAVGTSKALYTAYWTSEMKTFLLLAGYVLVGLYHLLLFVRRRQDRHNLLFAVFCISVAFYWFFRTYSRDVISDIMLRIRVEFITLYLLGPLLILFLSQFFRRKYSRVGLAYLAFNLVLAAITVVGSHPLVHRVLSLWQVVALPFVLYFLGFVVHEAFWRKNPDARYLLAGMALLVASVFHDILAARGLLGTPHVARYTFTIFILGIAGILANRFMRVHNEVEELNANLEKQVEDRTRRLQQSLTEVRALKVQQDGDYYLTSLLLDPLSGIYADEGRVCVAMIMRQKKAFRFRRWEAEIGGDLVTAHSIKLRGKLYTAVLNGDAMGKSMQGAGGALVLGTVFKAVVTRTQFTSQAADRSPERWLKDCFMELQTIFVSFDGTMMLSAVIGLVEHETGMFYFINAEHPFSVLYRSGRARFIEDQLMFRKIGIGGLKGHIQIQTFRMQQGDVVILGSDGRDDIQIGEDARGNRIVNEDETLFLRCVEEGRADLRDIATAITRHGTLIDDFTLVRISFDEDAAKGTLPAPEAEEMARFKELMNGDPSAALPVGRDLLRRFPQDRRTLAAVGRLEGKLGDSRKAADILARYVELYPEDDQLLYRAAAAAKKARLFDQAIDLGERHRLRDPAHVRNLVNLADAYRLMQRLERAFVLLEEAQALDPGSSAVQRLSAVIDGPPESGD